MDKALAGIPSLHRLLPSVVTDIQQGKAAQAIHAVPDRSEGRLLPPSAPVSPAPSTFSWWSVPAWPSSVPPVPSVSSGPVTSWPLMHRNRRRDRQKQWAQREDDVSAVAATAI